jgi:hypothetical protein
MAGFIVSFDLRRAGQDYPRLYARLSAWNAVKILQTVVFIEANTTSDGLRDDLMAYIDSNDGLIVIEHLGRASWCNIPGQAAQALSGMGR